MLDAKLFDEFMKHEWSADDEKEAQEARECYIAASAGRYPQLDLEGLRDLMEHWFPFSVQEPET